MRLQVRIEKRTTAPDPAGERVTSWVLVALRRAEKLQTPGRELWVAAQRAGRVPTIFKLRHPRSDFEVKPQMRLTCDGKLYDIISAHDPDGRQADLLVTCEELVNEPAE
jgi:SPP1 family predicted phage head-tail adaptor